MNKKEFLVLTICICLTSIAWLAAEAYHEFISTQGPKDVPPPPVIKDYNFKSFDEALRLLQERAE